MKARPLALLLAVAFLAVAFLVAACGGAGGQQEGESGAANNKDTAEKSGGGMAGMDRGSMGAGSKGMARQMVMENGEYSDEEFIDAMVPHHQGAVEMANVALKNAEHQQIEELSRNIISSQQAEIKELKSIKQEEYGTSRVPMDMGMGQMKGMGMMMDPQSLAGEDPFDQAFLDAMIPHHRSAISMAEIANEKSKNPRIKELAGNIVGAQEREIEQMRRWRELWYQEG
jgi:uncharacterized protein (DUF305 family)